MKRKVEFRQDGDKITVSIFRQVGTKLVIRTYTTYVYKRVCTHLLQSVINVNHTLINTQPNNQSTSYVSPSGVQFHKEI